MQLGNKIAKFDITLHQIQKTSKSTSNWMAGKKNLLKKNIYFDLYNPTIIQ